MHDLLSRFVAPPEMPPVRWPAAARVIPRLQEIGKGLYQGAYLIGYADGFNLGVTLGIVAGVLATIAAAALAAFIHYCFFKPVRQR